LELRFHFGERDRDGGRPLEAAVMDACERAGVWAAALLRGVEGFGGSARERTDRLLSLSEDAPLVAVAVGDVRTIEALAEEVRGIAGGGLWTLDGVEMVGLTPTGSPGELVWATIWGDRSGSRSPHLRAVDAFFRHGAEAATVLLGVDGVLDGERRRARFVAANRGVPAMTVAVGARGAILAAIAEVGGVADLVTIVGVEPLSVMGRERLHGNAESDAAGGGTRVTLVTSESTRCGGQALYLEFVHALRRAGAPGATALRGVWGFRGDVAPHGDRVLALRRDVPVIVETIDMAERASRWLEIAEGLAGEPDAVHSQRGLRILTLD
jgi:PII-like signaling protein